MKQAKKECDTIESLSSTIANLESLILSKISIFVANLIIYRSSN